MGGPRGLRRMLGCHLDSVGSLVVSSWLFLVGLFLVCIVFFLGGNVVSRGRRAADVVQTWSM